MSASGMINLYPAVEDLSLTPSHAELIEYLHVAKLEFQLRRSWNLHSEDEWNRISTCNDKIIFSSEITDDLDNLCSKNGFQLRDIG